MEIFYESHMNERVDLKGDRYHLLTGGFYNWGWDEETSDMTAAGDYSVQYSMQASIEVYCKKSQYLEAFNALFECFEKDTVNKKKGRLYVDGQYLECNISKGAVRAWEAGILSVWDVKIVTDRPVWISRNATFFQIQENVVSEAKRYPYRYPYRYASGTTDRLLVNDHYAASNMILTIYGKCAAPSISIGGHEYHVNAPLEEGEYMVIHTGKRVVYKVKVDGIVVNLFNNQDKESYLFEPIHPGSSRVSWSGKFAFSADVLIERRIPECRSQGLTT